MLWTIAIWLSVALALGLLGETLLAPADPLATALVFALPLLVLGLQERARPADGKYRLIRLELFSSTRPYRQLTFWGLPLTRERAAEGIGEDDPAAFAAIMLRTLQPTVINAAIGLFLPPEPEIAATG